MKRVVISSFITLVILGIISLAYFYFQRYSIVSTDPINGIPSNAFFFIEATNAKNALKKLSDGELLSGFASTDSSTATNLKLLDSALADDSEVKEIWEKKKIYLSAHLTKANSFDYLYLCNVPSSWTDEKTEHFISNAFHIRSSISRRVYENTVVHEITISAYKNFSFAVSKGIFLGSFTSFLIDDAIRQLKNGTSVDKSKAFLKVSKSSGDNEDASVFLNYISLREFFSSFSSSGNTTFFNALGSFARWTKLNAVIQKNGLLFQGLTASSDTADFISSLAGQQPQKIDVTDILPLRTALFIHIGLSDYQKYFQHLLSNSIYYDSPIKRTGIIKAIEKKFPINLKKNLTEWIGNEMTLVITEPGSISFSNSSYACIRANDITRATTDLLEVQNAINKNDAPFSKQEEYRKHPWGFINLAGLVPLFYGNLFSNITKFYYTTAGNYVVIANQSSALYSFIDDYEDNKSLAGDAAFRNLSGNAERASNFYCYINMERSKNIFRHFASADMMKMIDDNSTLLSRFSMFSFQLVNRKENFETTVQLMRTKEKINDASLLWSVQLDTTVTTTPFLFTNSETKKNFILVQDEKFNVYLLDEGGNTTWKKTIPEKIIGNFHIVDANRNGQQQILFNTASQLYLLDLTGNEYGNFPIRLPATATNGCSVFDFDQSKNYKVFVACSNRMIYTYEVSGKPMSGWLFSQPVSNVTKPLQNFNSQSKDYLVIFNNSGTVFVLDKKGSTRVALKQTLVAEHSTFALISGDSLDEDHLVTTDTSGKIISIYFNGTVKPKSFGNFSADHSFTAADIDGDGNQDFIFLDHHQVKAFKQDGAEIYSRVFIETVLPEIFSFSFTPSQQQPGIGSFAENKFYILDKDGTISHGFPVKGFKGISSTNWGTEGKTVLATTGSDGNVYLYIID